MLNILLVDDSQEDVEITLKVFDRAKVKHHIDVVHDGKEAMNFLHSRETKPDLILLDIQMPKVNGFEFMLQVKKDCKFNSIPVVMLTSSRNERDIIKSYEAGASGYIPKPLLYEDFGQVVEAFNNYWMLNKLPVTKDNKPCS